MLGSTAALEQQQKINARKHEDAQCLPVGADTPTASGV